jgi:predicted kinase
VLVVVSGLPGVGKSTVADAVGRHLGAAVLSVDPIEAAILRSGIDRSFETGLAAYEVVSALAEEQLRLGLSAVADAVSGLEVARDMWRRAAERTRSAMQVIEVVCSDEDLHRRRLASRQRAIEGFPEPAWEEVVARRDEWEPWTEPRLVVDTVRPASDVVREVVEHLSSH